MTEGAFRDVYQALDLELPTAEQVWNEKRDVENRIRIPLKLAAGDTLDTSNFWVVENDSMLQIEQLVNRSDELLLSRLSFAVVEYDEEEPVVVLRARPSRQAPPVLVLDCQAYRPYLNLPNLFLPNGWRMHPPLRRDALAQLLAKDKQRVTWLSRQDDSSFVPMSVPESSFRPMSDWVEYVLSHQHVSLKGWVGSNQFDFEHFVCKQDKKPREKPLIDRSEKKSSKPDVVAEEKSKRETKIGSKSAKKPEKSSKKTTTKRRTSKSKADAEHAAMKAKVREIEVTFMAAETALDDPSRNALWHQLAELNAELGNRGETNLCMSNLFWNQSELDPELLSGWLDMECRTRELEGFGISDLDALFANEKEQHKSASLAAAFVILCANQGQRIDELQERLGQLTRMFEACERLLPVRTVWLVALAMHKINDGDTLGLARTRDRLLDRLFQRGLQLEFDIASFMRGSGSQAGGGDRLGTVRKRSDEFFKLIEEWVEEPVKESKTRTYINLIRLFAMGRMDEETARDELETLVAELVALDETHAWLGKAFRFRIEQELSDEQKQVVYSETVQTELDALPKTDRVRVDYLRRISRILEPHLTVDPYTRYVIQSTSEIDQKLQRLSEETDAELAREKLLRMLAESEGSDHEVMVLTAGLQFGPRLGERFALELAQRTESTLSQSSDPLEKANLLRAALFVAAHFGSIDLTQDFVRMLGAELPTLVDEHLKSQGVGMGSAQDRMQAVESMLVQSFRGLRKLGCAKKLVISTGRSQSLCKVRSQTKERTRLWQR